MALDNDEFIRVRAYHLWEADGRPEGRDLEFWARAQQTLSGTDTIAQSTAKPARAATRTKVAVAADAKSQKRRRTR